MKLQPATGMDLITRARCAFKWAFFPGLNLHARLRDRRLAPHLGTAAGKPWRVLDAGCGNGMLSRRSYDRGATVLGVSIKDNEVLGCRALFHHHLGITDGRLRFDKANLYEIELEREAFDEVICTEVLEHIRDDALICGKFWDALRPGGVLHITSPNADHPYNKSFALDHEERGGHVRPGYTLEDYRALLEPLGFRIEAVEPLGGPVRQFFNKWIKRAQAKLGPAGGLPLFLLVLPALALESRGRERACPFAYYVRAVKRPGRTVDAAAGAGQHRPEHRIGSVAAG